METRGRGRDARASSDDPRTPALTSSVPHLAASSSHSPSVTNSNSAAAATSAAAVAAAAATSAAITVATATPVPTAPPPPPPSTRSRSRRDASLAPGTLAAASSPPLSSHAALLLSRSTRSRRASRLPIAAPPLHGSRRAAASSSSSAAGSPLRGDVAAVSAPDRPRRSATVRRASAALPPPAPSADSHRSSRKRTRSSARRLSGPPQPSSAALPLSSPPSRSPDTSPPASSTTPRASKRPRRASHPQRSTRSNANSAPLQGSSSASPIARRTRGMSSSGHGDEGHDRPLGDNSASLPEDAASPLTGDRAGPTTLQGLLRRLGAELSDIMPGNSGASQTRWSQLRTAIATPDSTEQQIEALSELCEFLSVGTEESMVSFSVNMFVGPLVGLLRTGANIEVKIYAARALTHMMEALPSSSSVIAINGAAGPLCENLLSIEYIDLAEQSLSALHKLSVDYPQQIVSANGFQAVLSYIDFFSIGVQRVAASTACNLCRSPRLEAMSMITGVLPSMMRLLDSDDQRIRESTVTGFTRLAEAFRSAAPTLETLCGDEKALIDKILSLIVSHPLTPLSPQSYSSALRLLAVLSRGSAALGFAILSNNALIEVINNRLISESSLHAVDCLNLADSLLPEMPETETATPSTTRSRRPRRSSSSLSSIIAVDVERREKLQQNAQSLHFFGHTLFETLMKFYVSSADSNARKISLSVMSKFIAFASQDVLLGVITGKPGDVLSAADRINSVRFCPFVAALLGENSSSNESLAGLLMASASLQKVPSLLDTFLREGVVHEIIRLAALDSGSQDEAEGPKDSIGSNDLVGHGDSGAEAGDESNPVPSGGTSAPASGSVDGEAIWSAVATAQRGATRSRDLFPSHRTSSRTLLELRMPHSVDSLIRNAARAILKNHLAVEDAIDESVFKNTTLGKLTEVCEELRSLPGHGVGSRSYEVLSKLVGLLCAPEGLTVFEVSKSGALAAIADYLFVSNQSEASLRVQNLMRCLLEGQSDMAFSSLVILALGALSSEEKLPLRTSESSSLTGNSSVSSSLRQLRQQFKLRLRKAPVDSGGAGLRDYAHNAVLIEPFATMANVQEFLWPKVRELDRASGSGSVAGPTVRRRSSRNDRQDRDVTMHDSPAGHFRGDTAETAEDEFGDDRYGVEEMFDMEEENEEEEEEEHNSEPSDEEVSSGEEDIIDQDSGDSDANENEAADSLDVDQLAHSMPPVEVDHDVLGPAPARSDRQDSIGGAGGGATSVVGEPSRAPTFRSYAAALAANMSNSGSSPGADRSHAEIGGQPSSGQDNRRSRRGNPVPTQRLSFSLNGKVVSHTCSILSAVIQASDSSRGIGPRLWSEEHTLVYSAAPTPVRSGQRAVDTPSERHSMSIEVSGPLRRSQRLLENRERSLGLAIVRRSSEPDATEDLLRRVLMHWEHLPAPPEVSMSDLPESISQIASVLRHLYWIYAKVREGSCPQASLLPHVTTLSALPPATFVSDKSSAKILRQISDPLALCGGVVPEWCFSLARDSTFLIPFETRRLLFQSTALGVTRALHLLQTRADLNAGNNNLNRQNRAHREEARVGRIQRQKVRIYRHRILESAIRVMNFYSSHSTVLEVQYFDEAGIGLGPTLEFYTLASRELQRIDLGLWRCATEMTSKQKPAEVPASTLLSRVARVSSSGSRSIGRRRNRRHSTPITPAVPSTDSAYLEDNSPGFVAPTGNGLYPSCLPVVSSDAQKELQDKTTTSLFGFVGRLLGKAIMDSRLLDLRFSRTFSRLLLAYCRVILEQRGNSSSSPKHISDIDVSPRGKFSVDEELDRINRRRVWDVFSSSSSVMSLLHDVDAQLAKSLEDIASISRKGQDVSALFLTFVLPGDDKIELVRGGKDKEVTNQNVDEFLRRVVYHVLYGGVYQQAEALLRGLGDLIDVTRFLIFESQELELLSCGPPFEKWSVDFLVQATRCDHGYSHESPSVMHFLRILSELDQEDQQRFVRFTTGAPALPLGGLGSLHPRLTIVRRAPEGGRSPDECLPTVMTCTNYFKLPDYSSYEIAKKQIMYAVREGQRSFHLS